MITLLNNITCSRISFTNCKMLVKSSVLKCLTSHSLTYSAKERLSNVFDVIVFMQHINMMLQLFYSASPKTHTYISHKK